MTRYYAARVHDSVDMQRDTVIVDATAEDYDAAFRVHTQRLSREPAAMAFDLAGKPIERTQHWRPAVLLDLGTVDISSDAVMRRLLMTDPLLRAVFDLGHQMGRLDADAVSGKPADPMGAEGDV